MKKHLAIVCGVYYPEPSPTGLCARRFAEVLSDTYDIEIVCIGVDGEDKSTIEQLEHKDNRIIKIHTVGCRRLKLESKADGMVKKLIHFMGSIQIKTRLLGSLAWYRRNAFKKLEAIHLERNIDVVFTICSPFVAHFVGLDIKKKYAQITHCGYTVDPYSTPFRVLPFFLNKSKLVAIEKHVLSCMKSVLVSEELYDSRKDLLDGLNNYDVLPYMLPDFREKAIHSKFFSTEGVNCVYAGRFYKDIRHPEFMLRVFAKLAEKNIKLHLFSVGCDELVDWYASKYKNIIKHEQVSHELIYDVYSQADILVGLGNTTADFFPSKTFEYVAALKPIVYINHGEMTNTVLESYPIEIQISDYDSIDFASHKVEVFCLKNQNEKIDCEVLKDRYYRHSKDNIKEMLNRCCGL